MAKCIVCECPLIHETSVEAGACGKHLPLIQKNAMKLYCACRQLLDAPHQEHFCVRLNDEENDALEAIKTVLKKVEG